MPREKEPFYHLKRSTERSRLESSHATSALSNYKRPIGMDKEALSEGIKSRLMLRGILMPHNHVRLSRFIHEITIGSAL